MADAMLNLFGDTLLRNVWTQQRSQAQDANQRYDFSAPDYTDEAVIQAQLERKQRLQSMQGRASTFLTGPGGQPAFGDFTPSNEIAKSMLLAKLKQYDWQKTYSSGSGTSNLNQAGTVGTITGPGLVQG